jgi:Zn-finger nucleic acid-binding protein
MRCPACGAPLVPDELQVGLYQCAQCGDVEVDEGGAYVRGRFYELASHGEDSPLDEWDAPPEEYVPTWEDVLSGDESAWLKED